MLCKVLILSALCALAVAFPTPPPAPLDSTSELDSTGEPEFPTYVEITCEVVLSTAVEVTIDGDSTTDPQQTANSEAYEWDTQTFEFSTDVKMATSSFVDETSEATHQISTSTESNESATVLSLKQSKISVSCDLCYPPFSTAIQQNPAEEKWQGIDPGWVL
jgi:hypothetical protein